MLVMTTAVLLLPSQAEEFDYGGQGIAYLDTDAGNNGEVCPEAPKYLFWTVATNSTLWVDLLENMGVIRGRIDGSRVKQQKHDRAAPQGQAML